MFGLYALYRKIFERTIKPDKKLYKELWAIQKACADLLALSSARSS